MGALITAPAVVSKQGGPAGAQQLEVNAKKKKKKKKSQNPLSDVKDDKTVHVKNGRNHKGHKRQVWTRDSRIG